MTKKIDSEQQLDLGLAGAIAPAATTAREFLLVESRQDAPAPRYRVVQRFPLGG